MQLKTTSLVAGGLLVGLAAHVACVACADYQPAECTASVELWTVHIPSTAAWREEPLTVQIQVNTPDGETLMHSYTCEVPWIGPETRCGPSFFVDDQDFIHVSGLEEEMSATGTATYELTFSVPSGSLGTYTFDVEVQRFTPSKDNGNSCHDPCLYSVDEFELDLPLEPTTE